MSKIFTQKGFNAVVLFIDLVLIYLSISLTYWLLKDSLDAYENNLLAFISVSPYIGLFYLIIAHIFELDKPKEFTAFGVAYSVTLTIACLFMLTMAMSFLTRKFAYPRSILIISSVFQIILLTSWHLFLNKKFLKNNVKKKILIVGYDNAKHLARKLLKSNGVWSNIKHICTPESSKLNQLILGCDTVFMADDVQEEKKQCIAEYCVLKQREFIYQPHFQEIFLFNASFAQVEDTPVLEIRQFGVDGEHDVLKRVLDVAIASIATVIFFIPFLIIAISLRIGGGSVIFKQERVTRGGRIFNIYKFRTMIENAEAMSGPTFAQHADKRITKLGTILRSTRLDEIPQIYNILKGDMSIVGPRPERPVFVEKFSKEIPEYGLRHRVKAGLTGLAQVQGKYNTSVYDKLKYDLLYINSQSLAFDLKLMMQTLNVLLKKSSTEGVGAVEIDENIIDKLIEND